MRRIIIDTPDVVHSFPLDAPEWGLAISRAVLNVALDGYAQQHWSGTCPTEHRTWVMWR